MDDRGALRANCRSLGAMRRLGAALKVRRSRPDKALLSVVIPAYNVEHYLADCLESLLGQSYLNFEAIVVDDGSTDHTAAIAERYAAEDRRLRVVRQPNGGLGAARNRGVAEARGDYLAFLDSDDLLVPSAYVTMMSTITRTGSDMVVGTLTRERDGREQTTRLMRQNHAIRRERVSLSDMPLMLADVFAVNKIFRRRFWESAGLSFPCGIRYEDQPTLTRAFVAAKRFDVIPETVYVWRTREDGSSITQRRHELSDLVDRIASKKMSTELVRRTGASNLQDVWFKDVLPVDMWEYFRAATSSDDDYWVALRTALASFWPGDAVPFEQTRTPAQQRLMGWLVDHDRRDDLQRLIGFIDGHRGGEFRLRVDGGSVVAAVAQGGSDEPARSVFAVGDHERAWSG